MRKTIFLRFLKGNYRRQGSYRRQGNYRRQGSYRRQGNYRRETIRICVRIYK